MLRPAANRAAPSRRCPQRRRAGRQPREVLMSTFSADRPRSKRTLLLILLLILIAAVAGAGLYLRPRFESDPPQISVTPNVDVFGLAPLEIQVTDKGTGLKSFTATLSQGGTELNLAAEQFAQP